MNLQSLFTKYDKQNLRKVAGLAVDFILPPLCPITGDFVDKVGMISPAYWGQLSFIHDPFCVRCGAPFSFDAGDAECGACLDHPPVYHRGRSALVYNDASREIILKFKHGDQMHAARAFVPWLLNAGHDLIAQADIIIPVPLHRMRLLKRRYNQADIMARHLMAHCADKTYLTNGLIRTRNTESQGHKKTKDRAQNIRRAFAINPDHSDKIKGKNILILDDVYTTGATVNECAKTVLDHGATQVDILTLAKVVKE